MRRVTNLCREVTIVTNPAPSNTWIKGAIGKRYLGSAMKAMWVIQNVKIIIIVIEMFLV